MPEKRERENSDIAIVDFLDLDTSKITFLKPKQTKHNGSQIGIRYNGKQLFVKYEGVTLFGIQKNYDKEGKYYGTTMQINLDDDYLKKVQELDEFFMEAFWENKWGLNKNIKEDVVRGYDQFGEEGLWKRILKKPYKLKGNVREYLDYPSKMEFALFYRTDRLATKIFDWKCQPIPSENYNEVTAQSKVKFITAWFSLTRGTFGLTLKPKLMQVCFKERDNPFEECLLQEEEEEEDVGVWDNYQEGYDEYPEKKYLKIFKKYLKIKIY